jgi:hypothetical protein
MKFFFQKLFFIAILLCVIELLPFSSQAQKTKIMGKVTDVSTHEPMPFVNVYIRGTTIGTRTDFNGEYSLEFTNNADSLIASFMGYVTVVKPLALHKFQTIDYEMFENKFNLSEVVIRPTTNPAEILLKKIIDNKKQNSGEDIDTYQYESYTKIEFDANNISEDLKDKRMLKQFQFVFENVDTSTVNGKSYLPIFLTETMSDVYFRKSPKSKKEFIKASKISGIDNESIAQFMGDMYQNINVYDNYVTLFDKNFVSPIANFALGYYKYYLTDSTTISNKWCYKIMFKPRRKQELTFTGNFWVCDTSFAIKKIDMRIADDANINFINDLVTEQEFDKMDTGYWMLTKDRMVADFNIVNNTKNNLGFYGSKTTTFRDYIFKQPKDEAFYNTPMNITVEDGSTKKDDAFWKENRHDTLSKDEKAVYKMVDTIQTIRIFKTYVDIIKTIVMGYYVWGNFELGPYFNTISFNDLEGARFRLGGRTSNKFSTKLMIDGHIAYGTTDQTFKYGGGFLYMLNKNPRRSIAASYKYDIEQLGESQNSFISDNILASLLRRNPYNKLSMVKDFRCSYENEWFTGFSNTLTLIHRDIFPLGSTKFEFLNGGVMPEAKQSITTNEINLNTRFAYNEKFVFGEFERTSMGTEYPILEVKYSYGIPNILGGDYEYSRMQVGIEHWFNVGSFGWSKYIIETGRIWGKLPYPLLKLHEGNETWVFDDYAFNMMNYYEFVSDKYMSFYYVHHFDGLFLNKIPLMRKLKWREVASIRGLVGTLDAKNKEYNHNYLHEFDPTELMYEVNKPYFEAGVGIENILKVFRINAMWRLSHVDHPRTMGSDKTVSQFGILGTMQIYF